MDAGRRGEGATERFTRAGLLQRAPVTLSPSPGEASLPIKEDDPDEESDECATDKAPDAEEQLV